MKTYQDLISVGIDEKSRMDFVLSAITDHRNSEAYRIAVDSEAYYAKRNVTISKFQKFLYTIQGKSVPDLYSANYKTKSAFFRAMVIQQTQYVLSNGVTFKNPDTKEKLGTDFDYQIQKAAKKAMIDGCSFCFINFDHVEVFGFADTPSSPGFVPIYDEETSALRAGVRYWFMSKGDHIFLHSTLYEEDGYTRYLQKDSKDMRILSPKRGYIQTKKASKSGDIESIEYSNYQGFPIVPMYANDIMESELIGIRESIDCYDFIKNGLANDIDDTAGVYWTLKNSGGLDDLDLARFIERMRVVKAATVDDADADIEAHTLDIPVQARTAMLDILKADLYRDAMLLNVYELSASSKTATEIRAAYQTQDDKCGDFEYCITACIMRLLSLLGIDDVPTYKWNRIANQAEETNMIMLSSSVLGEKLTLQKLPFLTPEEVEARLNEIEAENLTRLTGWNEDESERDSEEEAHPDEVI